MYAIAFDMVITDLRANYGAVSYTHLDVYKRQGYACTLLEVSDGKAKVDFHFGRGAKV